jgi:hypothetical protein
LEFDRATSKKSLVFAELICNFPHSAMENVAVDSLPDESLFLISTDDLWYGDIIIYLQTQTFWLALSSANDVAYAIKLVNTLSSGILFTIEELTLFFDVV